MIGTQATDVGTTSMCPIVNYKKYLAIHLRYQRHDTHGLCTLTRSRINDMNWIVQFFDIIILKQLVR